MRKTKFAVDVDGVVRDILSSMTNYYNKRFHTKITTSDITKYNMEGVFTKVANPSKFFFVQYSRETFFKAKPFPMAIDALERLKEFGIVALVTKQTSVVAMRDTVDWIYKHKIPFDSICFTGNNKSHIVDGFDWFVDDYQENLKQITNANRILVDAPYNKDVDVESIQARRVSSLWEFANMF